MKRILASIILILVVFTGCKNSSQSPDEIRDKIFSYKKEISNLNKKVAELEILLDNDTLNMTNELLIDTLYIKRCHFKHYINLTANIDAENNVLISPQMNGLIVQMYVHEGQRVSRGQILAKIDDNVMRKNLAQLETSLILADTMYQKQKVLFDQNVVSEVQYLQAKNKKEALEKQIDVIKSQIAMTRITAPFSGIIDRVNAKVGELATPGRPVFQLVNLSTMIATADVPENYLPYLNIGDSVEVTFATYPDMIIKSKIYQKGNVIDPANRTYWLKVKFPNVKEQIKANMLGSLKMKDFEADNAIVVPTNILNKDINGWFLYIVNQINNENIVSKNYVEIGVSDNTNTIITSGLATGESIITKGFNQVTDGMKVQIAN